MFVALDRGAPLPAHSALRIPVLHLLYTCVPYCLPTCLVSAAVVVLPCEQRRLLAEIDAPATVNAFLQRSPEAGSGVPRGYNPHSKLRPTLGRRTVFSETAAHQPSQSNQEQLPPEPAIADSGLIGAQQQLTASPSVAAEPKTFGSHSQGEPTPPVPPFTQGPSASKGSASLGTQAIITVIQQSPAPGNESITSDGYGVTMFDGTHSTAAPGASITSYTWVATKLSDRKVVASGSGAMYRFDPRGWQLPAGLYEVGLLVVDDHLGNSIALHDIPVGLQWP